MQLKAHLDYFIATVLYFFCLITYYKSRIHSYPHNKAVRSLHDFARATLGNTFISVVTQPASLSHFMMSYVFFSMKSYKVDIL